MNPTGFVSRMRFASSTSLSAFVLALVLTTASNPAGADTPDPWEKLNRRTFAANDFLDRNFLRPVANGYTKVVPKFIRQGINNAFANIGTPSVALNQMLQGKPGKAASDAGRFLVNTTLGLGGLFDPATRMGMAAHNEDFGQTFQVWGLGTGPHIVLPLSGSSTLTDSLGSFVGIFTNPLLLLNDTQSQIIVRAVGVVDLRAQFLSAETLISGDKYLFLRDATLQRRAFLVKDGVLEEDPFLSDEEFDEEFDEEQ